MDEGAAIAFQVLEDGVPVYASGGEMIGTVDHVVAASGFDIFHGIVVRADGGPRFAAAELVGALHERGVDLKIDATEAASLPHPHGAAPVWHDNEPGAKPSRWHEFVGHLGGRHGSDGWTREQ
jgi:hypothetical protein